MKYIQAFLKFLISPFMIGTYFTAAFSYVALHYYESSNLEEAYLSPVAKILRQAHQYSTDFRLRQRGPRAGSDRVAILTVDEKSLEQEGRWPWPRGKIKKLVDELVAGGASVIAFDMIFAEPDTNAAINVLQKLKDNYPGGEDFKTMIDNEMAVANTDKDLAKAVGTHADHLVMGAYFEPPFFRPARGYQDFCYDQLFYNSVAGNAWLEQNVETLVIPINQSALQSEIPTSLPEALAEELTLHFERIAQREKISFMDKRRSKGLSTKMNKNLEIELNNHILFEKARYCHRWLIPEEDEEEAFDGIDENFASSANRWQDVIEEDESLANFSPKDGFRAFRQRQLFSDVYSPGKWWLNLEDITANTTQMAYFNAFLDSDGAIRKSNVIIRVGSELLPSLALRSYLLANKYMAQVLLDTDPKTENQRVGVAKIEITDQEGESFDPPKEIPVNNRGELVINYAGPRQMFPYLSAADVLSDQATVQIEHRKYKEESKTWEVVKENIKKADFYKDKIFVFGATATGIFDLRVTPFEENYPGVETHANIVDNLMREDFLVKHPQEEIFMFILLLGGGILLSFIISKLGAVWGFVAVSLSLGAIYYIDRFHIFSQGIVVAVVFPLTLILCLYFILIIYKYFTEERSKKHLKGTFGKYVSPAIVDEILSDPSKIELGGSKEHITVFFSDVRGFTTISEKLDAAALSDLLNSYLTPMTDIIFENKGTLDKYMGDAIMAFFGAPIQYQDHAKYASVAALQNLSKLKELQAIYQKKGLPMIDVGIGLNTGEMSVGNMGSETVRNYTVMGDAVNLGARLEGINKQYGTRIIISEFTEKEIRGDFLTREIDWVRVKGKAEPVKIHELISEGKGEAQVQEVVKWFNEGFHHYHEMNWDKSLQSFAKGLEVNPSDAVTKLYIQRCKDYQHTPPEENWDGVFTMTTK